MQHGEEGKGARRCVSLRRATCLRSRFFWAKTITARNSFGAKAETLDTPNGTFAPSTDRRRIRYKVMADNTLDARVHPDNTVALPPRAICFPVSNSWLVRSTKRCCLRLRRPMRPAPSIGGC
jgi:hypothetical protein